MLSRSLVPFIILSLSLTAKAAERTWQFDLKAPGTYEVHVQHRIEGADAPRGAEATYSFQTDENTIKRDLPFYPKDYDHPAMVLIADITSPQKAKVVISNLPSRLLQQTSVYVVDGNSRYPYEWFDPGQSVELKAAKQIREILKQSEKEIDLAKVKLAIDKLIDPSIDVDTGLKRIDAMVAEIKKMPGFGTSSTASMLALKHPQVFEARELASLVVCFMCNNVLFLPLRRGSLLYGPIEF